MAKFSVLKDNLEVCTFELSTENLNEREIFIGRSKDCDLVIPDQKISRNHVVINILSGMVSIKNISKLDNLLVNGNKVSQAIISQTDRIQFDNYEIKMEGLASDNSKEEVAFEKTEVFSIQEKLEENQPVVETQVKIEEPFEPLPIESNDDIKMEENEFSLSQEADSFDFNVDESKVSSISMNHELIDSDKTQVIPEFKKFILNISGPSIQSEVFEFSQEYIVVGRSQKKCHIVLDDNDVSSIHAKFFKEGQNIYVEDLNSSNGMYINGEKVKKSLLVIGDEVLIGSISLIVDIKSEQMLDNAGRLMPVNAHSVNYEERSVEIGLEEETVYNEKGKKSEAIFGFSLDKAKALFDLKKSKRPLVYGAFVAFFAIVLLIGGGDKKKVSKKIEKKITQEKSIASIDNKVNTFSESDMESFTYSYKLAQKNIEEGNLSEALSILDAISIQNPDYKNVRTLLKNVQTSMEQIEEDRRQAQLARERQEKLEKIEKLAEKISKALEDEHLSVAEDYLVQIAETDPQSSIYGEMQRSIASVKLMLAEEERKRIEKENAIKKFNKKMSVARKYEGQKEFFKALKYTEEAMEVSQIDTERNKEASQFYNELKSQMDNLETEHLTNAREFLRGDNFKRSFEEYNKLIKINPSNSEASRELASLVTRLNSKAQYVFREGLVAESISLFRDARAKYEEVLQVAPIESDYYKRAKDKLALFYIE